MTQRLGRMSARRALEIQVTACDVHYSSKCRQNSSHLSTCALKRLFGKLVLSMAQGSQSSCNIAFLKSCRSRKCLRAFPLLCLIVNPTTYKR